MILPVTLPDELVDELRYAFQQQDKPAADEQLAEACARYLLGTAAQVRDSETRAAALEPDDRVKALHAAVALRKAMPMAEPEAALVEMTMTEVIADAETKAASDPDRTRR